ncbi:MAG: ATP-binding protein [Cyanothece sp. SIO2G6]|nr:ATP-binding protein [Cyanothece sp. SIO2G6]
MNLDLAQFFQACNPSKTLSFERPEDRQYYIDFAKVRGRDLIRELSRTVMLSGDHPTCQLFTGHIGCGKSTELLRLKAILEDQGFHTVYFESSQDMDLGNIDVSDILLAIARRVSASLETVGIRLRPRYFQTLFQEVSDFLTTPIDLGMEAELSLGIGKLTAQSRDNPRVRDRIRDYLEPRTNSILDAINQELFAKAREELHRRGKKGLVVIVDNLDRIDNVERSSTERRQPAYLFVERGEKLRQLNCHVVYTIPMVLIFSNDLSQVINRFGVDPKVLPMIPTKLPDGTVYDAGLNSLRHMVLTRAFPHLVASDGETWPADNALSTRLGQVFDHANTLTRLCSISGGHVRNLLVLLRRCLEQADPPITRACLEAVIVQRSNEVNLAIQDHEWKLLCQVAQQRRDVRGEDEYQLLLESMFVLEYRQNGRLWFDINPILAETDEFQERCLQGMGTP